MKQIPLALLLILGSSQFLSAQQDLDALAEKYARQSFPEFFELLRLPNDAHFPDDIERNVQWAEMAFAKRKFTTKRLPTETVPLLLAERKSSNPNARTVLIYLQIDGQPVDSSFWFQESPWQPVLKEEVEAEGWTIIPTEKLKGPLNPDWRIFARSTSDAKGPVMMFLATMDALNDLRHEPDFHLKVIMDFEEELGSPHLPQAVNEYSTDLTSDMLVIFDGPPHYSNQPTLTFGARGISTITLTVFGPRFPQHSGNYGNFVPNPALRLSQLLAGMKDESGRVTIPGFYDGISFDEQTAAILKAVPDDENTFRLKMGFAEPDAVAATFQEAIQYPTLNIRGLQSGWVGEEVRTIIPATATAEIDIRTVLENDPEQLLDLVKNHIASEGYLVLDREPTVQERLEHSRICSFQAETSYKAFRTDFDSEPGVWLSRAMVRAFGKEPIKIRTAGGSIPISPFVNTLGIPAVAVPTVNPDNNQHSPNENIRIGNYVQGIKTMLAIFTEKL